MPARPARKPASNPASISSPFSGLRFGFPNADVRIAPSTSVAPFATRSATYVRIAEYGAGARPACPHAVRSRKLSEWIVVKIPLSHGSSDNTHDSPALG